MEIELTVESGRCEGESLRLGIGQHVIGRGAVSKRIDDPRLSREHCLIDMAPEGTMEITDLGSRNGTFVNGIRISGTAPLQAGDLLKLGNVKLSVRSVGPAELRVGMDGRAYEIRQCPGCKRALRQDYQGTLCWACENFGIDPPPDIQGFKVGECIGRGSISTVYKAHNSVLNRDVAVRVFSPKHVPPNVKPSPLVAFDRASALYHVSIAQVYEIGRTQDRCYAILELLEGEPVSSLLDRYVRFEPTVVLRVTRQIALALLYAHAKGVVHGDIRPDHVMLKKNLDLKITSFGLSKPIRAAYLEMGSSDEAVLGFLNYLPPEMLMGSSEPGPETDIYCFGVMLYRMLTGRLPFVAGDAHALTEAISTQAPPSMADFCPGVLRSLENIVARCLAKRPARRFDTMDEIYDRLCKVEQLMVKGTLAEFNEDATLEI